MYFGRANPLHFFFSRCGAIHGPRGDLLGPKGRDGHDVRPDQPQGDSQNQEFKNGRLAYIMAEPDIRYPAAYTIGNIRPDFWKLK